MVLSLAHSVLSLTLSAVLNMNDDVKIVDFNGRPSYLTQFEVHMTLVIGWAAFIMSNLVLMVHYLVHPSKVDFNLSRFRTRLFVYILGERIELPGFVNDSVFEEKENVKI